MLLAPTITSTKLSTALTLSSNLLWVYSTTFRVTPSLALLSWRRSSCSTMQRSSGIRSAMLCHLPPNVVENVYALAAVNKKWSKQLPLDVRDLIACFIPLEEDWDSDDDIVWIHCPA